MNFMFVLGNILIGLAVGSRWSSWGLRAQRISSPFRTSWSDVWPALRTVIRTTRHQFGGWAHVGPEPCVPYLDHSCRGCTSVRQHVFRRPGAFSGTRVLGGLPCPAREFGARRSSQSPEPSG